MAGKANWRLIDLPPWQLGAIAERVWGLERQFLLDAVMLA